jgi:hypothetical protein
MLAGFSIACSVLNVLTSPARGPGLTREVKCAMAVRCGPDQIRQ